MSFSLLILIYAASFHFVRLTYFYLIISYLSFFLVNLFKSLVVS
jgi:hypothetical protein